MYCIQRKNGDHQPKNDCLTPITPQKCNFLGNRALLNGWSTYRKPSCKGCHWGLIFE